MRKRTDGEIHIEGELSDRPYDTVLYEIDHSLGSFFFDKYFSTEKEEKTMGSENGFKTNNAIFYDAETNTPIMKLDTRTNLDADAFTSYSDSSTTTNLNGKIANTYYYNYSIDTNTTSPNTSINDKKENDTMDAKKILNVEFGFVTNNDSIRMSPYGMAVKNQAGNYVAYDKASGDIFNVEILNFKMDKMFFKMPVAVSAIAAGDVLIHNRVPCFVTGFVEDTGNPMVVDIYAGERKEIMLQKSPFGFNYCTKIVSLFEGFGGKMTADVDHPFGNLLPLMLLSGNDKMEDMMLPLMMMQGNQMDMDNPLMLYMLMGKDGKMSDMLPLMLMMNQQNK